MHSRLGKYIRLTSRKNGCEGITWETDWNKALLESNNIIPDIIHGTKIVIDNLREKWTSKRIANLCKYLELTYKDTAMEIFVNSIDGEVKIPQHFRKPMLGDNCKSYIDFEFSDGKLNTTVISDEFSSEAIQYCGDVDINNYNSCIDVYQNLKDDEIADTLGDDLNEIIYDLGEFSGLLYFNIVSSVNDMDKFLYKYRDVPRPIDGGIVLYRNAFSISSYEGEKDWLGLGKRTRKSPASATHQTGSWRVRENQISGYIDIDKESNKVLKDLSNRQGLEENQYYQIFIKIIGIAIGEFERYRQSIIRKINLKNKISKEEKTPVIDRVLKKPTSVKNFSNDEAKQLANEIKETKKYRKELKRDRDDIEEKYKYDVRILNVLSTIGLKAASIAHETKNDKNIIDKWYEYTIRALKHYGMWEELTSEKNTKLAYRNVPKLLEENQVITKKISLFMGTMLEQTEKRQFEHKLQDVMMLANDVVSIWKRDYAWVNIVVTVEGNIEYVISRDVFQVIFDNLILNSVQQNNKLAHLNISIEICKRNGFLYIKYHDDGIGLQNKYVNDPRRILEVHETSRRDGHGLGMWIINNTCVMSGGEIIDINGNDGFYIAFTLGGKL